MHRTLTRYSTRILFTLCCAIVFRGLTKAQDLTAPELLAPVGTSFHAYDIVDLFPWDTLQGPGVTWDYAWTVVDSTSSSIHEVIALNDAPAAGSYPDADRVVRSISGFNGEYVIDRFFDVQSDRITELGSAGPVLSYVFDAPETVYNYPMALGDTVRGDYCFWSDGLGIQFHFCGESYVTFDAMGTLILPYGTFTGVKHITRWSSSFETTEPALDSSYSVRQQWFLPGVAFPVLDATLFIAQNGDLYPSGRLLDQASITAVAETAATPAWSMWPNPANGAVRLTGLPTDTRSIELLTTDGRLVHRDAGIFPTSTTLTLEDVPDGFYLVRVIGERGSSTRQLVKAR